MDKKSKNTLIVSIIALAFVLIGVTYAYFSARITGLESASTLSLTAGRMGIHYSEGDENVSVSNIYPREQEWLTKTITLTGWNTTDLAMNYELGLNVTTNTFTRNYITYDLTLISGSVGTPISNITGGKINGTGHIRFGYGQFTQADGDQHIYELKIYFKDNGQDQNDSQNAVLNGKIYVTDAGTGTMPTGRYYFGQKFYNNETGNWDFIISDTLAATDVNNTGMAIMTYSEEVANFARENENNYDYTPQDEYPYVCGVFDNGEFCFTHDTTPQEFQSGCTAAGGIFVNSSNSTWIEYNCQKNTGNVNCSLSSGPTVLNADCYNEEANIQCVATQWGSNPVGHLNATCTCWDC